MSAVGGAFSSLRRCAAAMNPDIRRWNDRNRTYALTATSGLPIAPGRLLRRLGLSLVFLLADVHLSVVKLGQSTGLAPDGVARLVVIPPAVVVPGAAPARPALGCAFASGTTLR